MFPEEVTKLIDLMQIYDNVYESISLCGDIYYDANCMDE